jgi:hypothetical protein
MVWRINDPANDPQSNPRLMQSHASVYRQGANGTIGTTGVTWRSNPGLEEWGIGDLGEERSVLGPSFRRTYPDVFDISLQQNMLRMKMLQESIADLSRHIRLAGK